jgi:FSR family fosmidomycin resistance protein-like MFS transporter
MVESRSNKGYFLLGFLASTHFTIHVFTQLLPVLLLPLRDELGVSLVQISLLASIPRLLNVVTNIPSGILADRRPTLVLTLSFVVTAIGALLIPISWDFAPILIGFTLLSLGSTLYHPPSMKMASEFDADKLSFAMGIHNVGANLGFAAGPLLVGALMPTLGWRFSFFIWAPLTFIMAVVSFFYGRRTLPPPSEGQAAPIFGAGLRTILSGGFLIAVAVSVLAEAIFNVLFTFVPAFFTIDRGMSYSVASIISGLGPLAGLLGSFIGGLGGDKYGKYRMGVAILLLMTVLYVAFPLSRDLWTLAILYALYRCLQAAFMPLMNSMIAFHSNPEHRSLSFSLNFVAVNLVGAIIPTATSLLIEAYGTSVIFPISIGGVIPTIALIVALSRNSRQGK